MLATRRIVINSQKKKKIIWTTSDAFKLVQHYAKSKLENNKFFEDNLKASQAHIKFLWKKSHNVIWAHKYTNAIEIETNHCFIFLPFIFYFTFSSIWIFLLFSPHLNLCTPYLMFYGIWLLFYVSCFMFHVYCLLCNVQCLMPNVQC